MYRFAFFFGWLFLGLFGVSSTFAQQANLRPDSTNFWEKALSVSLGGDLVIDEVALEASAPAQTMVLQRFALFSSDAQIRVHAREGDHLLPIPKNAYFQGRIQGNPSARVFLSVLERGIIRGIISDRGRFWIAAGGEGSGGPIQGMAVVEVDAADLAFLARPMQCESDFLAGDRLPIPSQEKVAQTKHKTKDASYTGAAYNARIAIETDFQYYQKFNDETAASDYAADLIAYTSTIYSAEVNTSLTISHISIWTSASDPWVESSTVCGLFEFGRYWNNNRTGVDRTLAHFLSGKNNGGGVAWVGVLCNPAFNFNHQGSCPGLSPQTSNYGGDYGYSGDLDANFDINNPSVVWDLVVVSHEIGHNFNSPHTHCYQNIGGNAAAIDQCHSGQCGQAGCYCGGTSLPCGSPGTGCGTIMSYCHLLSGGISNISMTLGTGHPQGIAPERVAQRMSAAVVSANQSSPSCLPENASLIDLLALWPNSASILDLIPLI